MVTVCIAAIFLAGGVAQARDRSFAAVLDGLKQDYDLKPQMAAGVCLAKCVAKVIPTPGISKIDFVLLGKSGFQDLSSARDLNAKILGMLGSDWKPFVQVDSTQDREHALIFARPSGNRMDLLVLNLDPDETVAVFVRVNAKVLKKWIH